MSDGIRHWMMYIKLLRNKCINPPWILLLLQLQPKTKSNHNHPREGFWDFLSHLEKKYKMIWACGNNMTMEPF